jgi:uncharacterized membrane protein
VLEALNGERKKREDKILEEEKKIENKKKKEKDKQESENVKVNMALNILVNVGIELFYGNVSKKKNKKNAKPK